MFTVNNEKFNNYDEAVEYCHEQEIIYYHEAMRYLTENDASLRESLNYANEYGLSLESLNSETLATVLYQQNLLNEIKEIKGA